MGAPTTKKKPFNVRLRADLHERLQRVSILHGSTMTALIEAALDKFLPAEEAAARQERQERYIRQGRHILQGRHNG